MAFSGAFTRPFRPAFDAALAAAAGNGLLTGLVAYWSLDEASGNRADSKGSSTLTDMNTVGSAAGKQGNAASFISANFEHLKCASNSALAMGDVNFTVACWVNATTLPDYPPILSKWDSLTNKREYRLIHYQSQFQFWVSSTGSNSEYVGTTGASTGQWYFIVAWHDATANKIYISVNNATPAEKAWSSGVANLSSQFALGAQADYQGGDLKSQWNGLIDEVGIWKRVLSAADRTLLYNAGAGLAYSAFAT